MVTTHATIDKFKILFMCEGWLNQICELKALHYQGHHFSQGLSLNSAGSLSRCEGSSCLWLAAQTTEGNVRLAAGLRMQHAKSMGSQADGARDLNWCCHVPCPPQGKKGENRRAKGASASAQEGGRIGGWQRGRAKPGTWKVKSRVRVETLNKHSWDSVAISA